MFELFTYCLEKGANLDEHAEGESEPLGPSLHIAVKMGNMDLVKRFRDLGANLNIKDRSGSTIVNRLALQG